MRRVKADRRGARGNSRRPAARSRTTKISAKNQATLPVDVLRQAGLQAGDEVRVNADGSGRIVLVRAKDAARQWAGCLTGIYTRGYLGELRREWR